MLARFVSAALVGIDAHLVDVEVDVTTGLPSFSLVGLPDASVRESRDRVRSAIRNSGFEFPLARITVNLSPADLRKAGTAFDVPIALGILAAAGSLPVRTGARYVYVGELSLDGAVRDVRGSLAIALAAARAGYAGVVVPASNAAEAALIESVRVLSCGTFDDVVHSAASPDTARACGPTRPSGAERKSALDLGDVRGQVMARRALEIAAAGRHHLLFVGPPGVGKSMLARRLPGILPPWTFEEAIEATSIHSVAGLLPRATPLLEERPFRAPHHTASAQALVGGGGQPKPGEITLAHHGVLFLDELPEFDRRVLEVLRQPLEEGQITIARAGHSARFPARFQLVAAMNPCPCGFRGSARRRCACTPVQVAAYDAKVSGPLRDRIDLMVGLPDLAAADLDGPPRGSDECSAAVGLRVAAARRCQAQRESTTGIRVNADLDGRALARVCTLDPSSASLLRVAAERGALTGRGRTRVLRVARTIADLSGAAEVDRAHVLEALQFRGGEPTA
ncbi:MAG: YifB family Mg chelatase-like AAA ATPase [Vicinamibacterales bacterium]